MRANVVATLERPDAPLDYADMQEYYSIGGGQAAGDVMAGSSGQVTGTTAAGTSGAVLGSTTGYSYASHYLYDLTPVDGDASVRRFYYIRQDHYMQLVPQGTDPAVLETYRTFGPHPIGAEVNTRIGFNYFFFPVCRNRFAADRVVEIRADEPPPSFKLTCRR